MRLPIVLAMFFRATNGYGIGSYILVYALVISGFGAIAFPQLQESGFGFLPLGKLYILWIFVCVLAMQLRTGWVQHHYGFRLTMIAAFIARSIFFSSLVMICLMQNMPILFLFCFFVGGLMFSACYTALEGTYDAELKKLAGSGSYNGLFGWSMAIQSAFAILGGTIAIWCYGAGTSASELIQEQLVWLPFAIAASITAFGGLLAAFLPRSTIPPPTANLYAEARDAFRKCIPFRRLTWITASSAFLFQGLSVLVPLILLSTKSTVWDRFFILVLGTFGPQFIGNIRQSFTARKPTDLPDEQLWRGIRRAIVGMAICSVVFSSIVLFTDDVTNGVITGSIFISIIGQRYFFGLLDPAQRQLATHMIVQHELTHLREMRMSWLAWWRAFGGLVVVVVSITMSLMIHDHRGEAIADSLLLILAAIFAVAAWFWFRPSPGDLQHDG